MADVLKLNVPMNFNLNNMTERLKNSFVAQGFTVTVIPIAPNSVKVKLEKNCGGINLLLGLGQGITANCTMNGDILYVNYTDGDWTGKIVGFAIGWIVCWVPFMTAIIGTVKQCGLSQKVSSEITMIASGVQNVKSDLRV